MNNSKLHIILIGNYLPDKQQSMNRFLIMLQKGFTKEGCHVEVIYPLVFFGKFFKTTTIGIGKWFSYIDKWILFPVVLRLKRMRKNYRGNNIAFLICDHSNAMYIDHLPRRKTVIVCHDVLAIRGAFGHKDAYCEASLTGKILQKWILASLLKSYKIAFVSQTTRKLMIELNSNKPYDENRWPVILNALNNDFHPIETSKIEEYLLDYPMLLNSPFILHVGSSLPRKNRSLLIEMLHLLGHRFTGNICFAGEAPTEEMNDLIHQYQLEKRVIILTNVSQNQLLALYNSAYAFIFPSFSEGFGWPVIEAQACGTPVIVSHIEPMPEVCGAGGLKADPYKPQEFADALLSLQNSEIREELILKAHENIKRFESDKMLAEYLKLIQL